jgi:hypothetical protein
MEKVFGKDLFDILYVYDKLTLIYLILVEKVLMIKSRILFLIINAESKTSLKELQNVFTRIFL